MSFRGARGKSSSTFSNLPFGLSYSDVTVRESAEMPSIPLPVNHPINDLESEVAANYINFKNALKDGPFFTGSMELTVEDIASEDGKGKEKYSKRKQQIDADGLNDGIERYSDKYLKKRKIGTSVDEHPFNLSFFPKELYQVMGINKKKLIQLSKVDKNNSLFISKRGSKEDAESAALSLLEKFNELAEDEDDGEEGNDENKDNEKEELDDEFDEEDDDDYNAEKYFDDGDDDFGGDDDYADEPAF